MKFKTLTLVAALSVSLFATGCATKMQTGMLVGGVVGAAVGGPIGGTAAAHWAGGLVGLVVGSYIGGAIGKTMDEHDHRMAQAAVTVNETKTWTNETTNNTYTVTPMDNGDGTSTVKTDMVKDNKTTTETTNVKRIKE